MKSVKKLSKHLKSEWSLKKPLYIDKKDRRYKLFVGQLKTNGFNDSETWALDSVIAKFILPRLIRFKELNIGYPGNEITWEKWNEMLDDMIFAFSWSLHYDDDLTEEPSPVEKRRNWVRHDRGMKTFAKWFHHLWW